VYQRDGTFRAIAKQEPPRVRPCSISASSRGCAPRGEKSKYTDKQERKADHIAEGYEKRGVSEKEAERRAWATVNKDDGGGKNPGDPRC
jgi:hypothetical protein